MAKKLTKWPTKWPKMAKKCKKLSQIPDKSLNP